MKKNFKFYAILWLASMSAAHVAMAEDISVTSYYPTPYGKYNSVESTDTALFATNNGAVSIGTTAAPPSCALLDMATSTTLKKGLLIPRLTNSQRDAISTPANGLLIYSKDDHSVEYYDSGNTPRWGALSINRNGPFWEQIVSGGITHIRYKDSGNVGIGTLAGVSPPSKLAIQDGGVVVLGTTTSVGGSNPFPGAGRRFMWMLEKGALRAGDSEGSQSTTASVGKYSFAFGNRALASGDYSVAMSTADSTGTGTQAEASGYVAVAIGENVKAQVGSATAIGTNVTASGSGAVAMGTNVSATNGAIALGYAPDGAPMTNSSGPSLALAANSSSPAVFIYSQVLAPPAGIDNNVGIGTTNPTARLEVNGEIYTDSSAVVCPSDGRLKSGVALLTGSLEKICRVQPVYFRWKKEYPAYQNDARDLGVIAQEVEKIFPEIVHQNGDYKTVDYFRLTPFILEAMKELKARNVKIQKEIIFLKKELEARHYEKK